MEPGQHAAVSPAFSRTINVPRLRHACAPRLQGIKMAPPPVVDRSASQTWASSHPIMLLTSMTVISIR